MEYVVNSEVYRNDLGSEVIVEERIVENLWHMPRTKSQIFRINFGKTTSSPFLSMNEVSEYIQQNGYFKL